VSDIKRPILDLEAQVVDELELPEVFLTPVRPDVIRRAYLSSLTARIQPQGRDPLAGLRTSAESWGAGHGVARVPRVKGRGYPAASRGARANQAVGGVRIQAPRADKVVWERINRKERRLAIRSAIAATASLELVSARHRLGDLREVPVVVVDDLASIQKTRDFYEFLLKLGLQAELERLKRRFRKIRAGRGKMRGRVRQRAKGPLVVYHEDGGISRAARNVPGVDVVSVRNVGVIHLAPGGVPGRLTIWTVGAIEALREEQAPFLRR